ncbi:MAG: hypothetical protein AB2L09_07285 [Coriobacteriia bacterium]
MYKAITVERQEIWSSYYGSGVTVQQALTSVIIQILAFYAVVNVVRIYMGPASFLQWASVTNMVMAAGPGILWMRRGSRKGSSVGLAIVILAGTINTFLPIGMFVQALPQVFGHPWFYLAGVIFTFIAAMNLRMVLRFPSKAVAEGGRKPIW